MNPYLVFYSRFEGCHCHGEYVRGTEIKYFDTDGKARAWGNRKKYVECVMALRNDNADGIILGSDPFEGEFYK